MRGLAAGPSALLEQKRRRKRGGGSGLLLVGGLAVVALALGGRGAAQPRGSISAVTLFQRNRRFAQDISKAPGGIVTAIVQWTNRSVDQSGNPVSYPMRLTGNLFNETRSTLVSVQCETTNRLCANFIRYSPGPHTTVIELPIVEQDPVGNLLAAVGDTLGVAMSLGAEDPQNPGERLPIDDILAPDRVLLTAETLQGRTPPCQAPGGIGGYGDVNRDGVINQADVEALAALGIPRPVDPANPVHVRADVTGNGFLDISDITAISAYVSGSLNTFPVCGAAQSSFFRLRGRR